MDLDTAVSTYAEELIAAKKKATFEMASAYLANNGIARKAGRPTASSIGAVCRRLERAGLLEKAAAVQYAYTNKLGRYSWEK